jgi:hypothetical protein
VEVRDHLTFFAMSEEREFVATVHKNGEVELPPEALGFIKPEPRGPRHPDDVVIPAEIVVLTRTEVDENIPNGGRTPFKVVFEYGTRIEQIRALAFQDTKLTSITIPASVVSLGINSFASCKSLVSARFESGSRLGQIEMSAFRESGLESIRIPASVAVLCKYCFGFCQSLATVEFEEGSRLERIEEGAFHYSGLEQITIPASVVALGAECFLNCPDLTQVLFKHDSRLERIESKAFSGTGIERIEIPQGVRFLGPSALAGFVRSDDAAGEAGMIGGWYDRTAEPAEIELPSWLPRGKRLLYLIIALIVIFIGIIVVAAS